MSAAKERTCTGCGVIEMTASNAKCCAKCYNAGKAEAKRIEERHFIEERGYTNVSLQGYNKFGKPEWTFTHVECGQEQTWTFNNLLARVNADSSFAPCVKCGGKRRMSVAMAAFIEKYGITEEQMIQYERYSKKVRHLSDKVYKANILEINPLNLKRGQGENDYHLDHIVPIVVGFKQALPPEFMARKENLQMLSSKENLSKGRK